MKANDDFIGKLMHDLPVLQPLLDEHLSDMDGELLPYLLLADVARWAQTTYSSDPGGVGAVVDWLEDAWTWADADQKDLIGLGFVEVIPFRPEGAALLTRLGPELTQVAAELGLLPHPGDLG